MEAASLPRAPPAVKTPIHTQHTGRHGDDGLVELLTLPSKHCARYAPCRWGGQGRAIIVAVMVPAAGLYGVELAEAGLKHIAGLDTAVMHALWGTSRPCRAKAQEEAFTGG